MPRVIRSSTRLKPAPWPLGRELESIGRVVGRAGIGSDMGMDQARVMGFGMGMDRVHVMGFGMGIDQARVMGFGLGIGRAMGIGWSITFRGSWPLIKHMTRFKPRHQSVCGSCR